MHTDSTMQAGPSRDTGDDPPAELTLRDLGTARMTAKNLARRYPDATAEDCYAAADEVLIGKLERLSAVAISDAVRLHLCSSCGGAGSVPGDEIWDSARVLCCPCDGTGEDPIC